LADKVFIDRLNYLNQLIDFYRRCDMLEYTSDDFFSRTKGLLVTELEKIGLAYELIF